MTHGRKPRCNSLLFFSYVVCSSIFSERGIQYGGALQVSEYAMSWLFDNILLKKELGYGGVSLLEC